MYHLRNATLYAPENQGVADIVVCGKSVAATGPSLNIQFPGMETVDCRGLTITPGFIDQHIHLIGGGGDEGYETRVPEVTISQLIASGTTSVVGVCGFDSMSKTMPALLAKARSLQAEGLSAWMYSGSYAFPPNLLTGTVRGDIYFVPEVLGVKIAYHDRNTSFPTRDELLRLLADIRAAGMMADKAGVLHVHLGEVPGAFTAFADLIKSGIPAVHIRPTHCARTEKSFTEAVAFTKRGGIVDLTSGVGCFTSFAEVLRRAAAEKAVMANITMSSDGNGRVPMYNASGTLLGFGVGSVAANLVAVRELVEDNYPLEEALPLVTSNVAHHLKLIGKGRIAKGMDADLCFFDESMRLIHVMAGGKFLMRDGAVLAKDMFKR